MCITVSNNNKMMCLYWGSFFGHKKLIMLTSAGLLPDTKKPEWAELIQFLTTKWWYVIYLAWAHIHWSIMATPPSLRSSRSSIEGSNRTISGNNLFSSFSSKTFGTSLHRFDVGVINGPQLIGAIIWIYCSHNPIKFVYLCPHLPHLHPLPQKLCQVCASSLSCGFFWQLL